MLRHRSILAILLALALAACGGSGGEGGGGADGGAPNGSDGGGSGADGGGGDGDGFVSRALVQITEQRITEPAFQNGSAYAYVTPFFAPGGVTCAQRAVFDEGGCEVLETVQPTCEPACGEDELCYADPENDCQTECRPACTRDCPDGEYCHLDEDGSMSCEPVEPFDGAGTITVDGLTQAVALQPPGETVTFSEAVFAGSEVQASASGTQSGVGLGAFELALSPPAEPIASPPLAELEAADLDGDLTLGWSAGGDDIEIQIFGGTTRIDCRADDAAGSFTVPAGALSLIPEDAAAVRIDLRRVREANETGVSTSGSYYGTELPEQAEAVLRLIRLETTTIAL